MQSKGAIRFLAIALAVVCVYQLSFTVVTNYWENKAHKAAGGDEVKEKEYLDSLATVPVYNLLIPQSFKSLLSNFIRIYVITTYSIKLHAARWC